MNRNNKLKEIDIKSHIFHYLDNIININDLILGGGLLIMLILHAIFWIRIFSYDNMRIF